MRRRDFLKYAGLLTVSSQLPQIVEGQSEESTWPMFQFDAANTGYNPSASIDAEQVGQQWRASTLGEVVASPVITNGIAYVASRDGKVYATNLEDGNKDWEYSVGNPIEAAPVASGENIYVGDSSGEIYSLSSDGSKNWKVDPTSEDDDRFGVYTALTFHEKKIFAVLYDPEFYGSYLVAIDTTDGSIVWRHPSNDTVTTTNPSAPVVSEDTVYVSMEGVRSIDIFDGGVKWSIDSVDVGDGVASVGGHLSLDGTDLIAAGQNLTCLNKSDGSMKWRYSNIDITQLGSAAINGRNVYVTSSEDPDDGFIYSFDRVTGEQQWKKQLRAPTYTNPIVTNDKVFTGSEDGQVYAFQRSDGSRLWTFQTGGSIRSTPAIVGTSLYIGSNDGYVYSIGKVNDSTPTPTENNSTPIQTSSPTKDSTTTPTEPSGPQSTPTQSSTQAPMTTPIENTSPTPTTTEDNFQRGFFTNGGDSPFAFLNNPFVLTVGGFFLSVFGIVYQLVEGD